MCILKIGIDVISTVSLTMFTTKIHKCSPNVTLLPILLLVLIVHWETELNPNNVVVQLPHIPFLLQILQVIPFFLVFFRLNYCRYSLYCHKYCKYSLSSSNTLDCRCPLSASNTLGSCLGDEDEKPLFASQVMLSQSIAEKFESLFSTDPCYQLIGLPPHHFYNEKASIQDDMC